MLGGILAKLPLFLGVILLLIIASLVSAYTYTRSSVRYARALLVDVQKMHLNASQVDVERFVGAHSGTKEIHCNDPQRRNCEFVIRLGNRWLARLHASPPTDLGVAFISSEGRVVRIQASIEVHRVIPGTFTTIYAAEVTEQLSDPELGPFHSTHKLAHNAPGGFIPWFVNQKLDERATEAQRKAAYSSLNLSCLYKLGGCKDAEALAPSAWTAADKVGWHDETLPADSAESH